MRLSNNHKTNATTTASRGVQAPSLLVGLTMAAALASNGMSASASCSLCIRGEDISNPDKHLDITNPIPLETCRDLSNVLLAVPDNSTLCSQARVASTLCGCPVSNSSCGICEDGSTMTLPLQLLSGLVDIGSTLGLLSSGFEISCEVFESVVNTYDRTEQRCADLPLDALRTYCACRTEEELLAEDDTTCHFCVGGEQPAVATADPTVVVVFPFEGDGVVISCADARDLANTTDKGSDVCRAIQGTGLLCGCPVPENSCDLCRGGDVGEGDRQIVLADGRVGTCSGLEAMLHLVNATSDECLLSDQYAAECGCTRASVAQFQPCTLCPLGERVPNPERNISGLEGVGFDFLEHNCGVFEEFALNVDLNSAMCKTIHSLGKVCGCAVRDNSCSICGSGNEMTKPQAESVWSINLQFFPKDFTATFDAKRPFTCEIVDTTLSYWSPADSDRCYWNQLTKGHACGCNGESSRPIETLLWTQRCSGIISLIGSLCILTFIFSQRLTTRWIMFHQLMLGISIFDGLSSITFILGTLPVPENTSIYGARGTEATCRFQGWMFQAGQISMFYNVALSTYFLLAIKYNWTDRRFRKIGRYIHTGLLATGFVLAFGSIPFHQPHYRWCYIAWPPVGESYVPGLIFFIAPVGICILAITVLTVQLVFHVYRLVNRSSQRSMSSSSHRASVRTFWQSLWFLAAFYVVWPVMLSTFTMKGVPHQNAWWIMVGAVLGPSQGLFNALIFFNRRRKTLKTNFFRMFGWKPRAMPRDSRNSIGSEQQQSPMVVVLPTAGEFEMQAPRLGHHEEEDTSSKLERKNKEESEFGQRI